MPRRLVICSDGTWNEPQKMHVTNVVKIARAIRPRDRDGISQIVFYDWGVGTGGWRERLTGGALGNGIDKNIMDAYRFLVHNYIRGDHLSFFGFSRGAYTVRSLVGLMRNCGLVRKKHADRIPEAYALYRSRRRENHPDRQRAVAFRKSFSREVRIHFLGVWDTVGALGVPLRVLKGLNTRNYSFHDTKMTSLVRHAYQALAIDEKRKPFRPSIWTTKRGRGSTEQAWFAGVHSDIGGGYKESGLSDEALFWMIDRATAGGLGFNKRYLAGLRAQDARDILHNSYKGFYRGLGKYIRPMGVTNSDEALHPSALARHEQRPGYRPANLVRYLTRTGNG
jgi:uncharacterized protein (DUF2235 family)